jgi:6-phosphogluconolactonase (cycloisomerase 2 family)
MSNITEKNPALRRNPERPCLPTDSRVNRRVFLAGMGMSCAAIATSPLPIGSVFERDTEELLLCLGSFGAADAGTLHLLEARRDKVRVLSTHLSERPSAIVRHPFRSLLYVANNVSLYQHRPRGTVETFAFDPAMGRLELVGRRPLSLAATRPRSLAVSPDGRSLLVAAFDGGAYNVLQIDESGLPSAPSTILKQVGRGEHPAEQSSAHPSQVVFHPESGIAVAADYGADRLDILDSDCRESGIGDMKIADRIPCIVGSGPSKIAMHPGGELFVVAHALRPALAAFRLTQQMKLVPIGHAPLNEAPTAICFSSQKNIVFAAAEKRGARQALLTARSVDPQRGTLQGISETALPAGEIASMHATDSTLWIASDRGMIAAELDAQTGTPRTTYPVLSIPNLRSMAVLQKGSTEILRAAQDDGSLFI